MVGKNRGPLKIDNESNPSIRRRSNIRNGRPLPKNPNTPSIGGKQGMDAETKIYVDSKTETTRAQNDAQFAKVMAEMETSRARNDAQFAKVMVKIDRVPTIEAQRKIYATQRNWFIGLAVAVLAALVGLFAFGGDRFESGMAATALIFERSDEARRTSEDNAKDIAEIKEGIENLLEIVRREGGAADNAPTAP